MLRIGHIILRTERGSYPICW